MQRLDLLVTRHFPRQAGKMRFAFGEQPLPTTGSKRDAYCPRLSAKIDNMLVSLMRIAPNEFNPRDLSQVSSLVATLELKSGIAEFLHGVAVGSKRASTIAQAPDTLSSS